MSSDDEGRLIEAAINGDLGAFEKLYRMHCSRVHGLCIRLCDSHADAQDATQETFVKAWRALGSFKRGSAFTTWLHRIAYNESMNLRRYKNAPERHLQLAEEIAGRDDSSTATEIEQLEKAVRRLPDRAREALVLHKIYGYTHEETAEFMGTTTGASKAQVHRAMKMLQALLDADPAAHTQRSAPQTGGVIADD